MLNIGDLKNLLDDRFLKNVFPIPATSPWSLGSVPPDFELPDITNGRLVKLSDYKSQQPIVVAFTRIFTEKHYCPLCKPYIKAIKENYQQFTSRGAELLMIVSTTAQQSQVVVNDLGLTLPLLSDPDCKAFRAYEVGQALGAPLPAQFVLDKDGVVRYQHLFSFLDHNAGVETLLNVLDQLPQEEESSEK